MQSKQWKDLTTTQKLGIIVLGVIQFILMGAALWDIRHRPADNIKGSKRLWVTAAFINFFGPIAYFWVGRKGSKPGRRG